MGVSSYDLKPLILSEILIVSSSISAWLATCLVL
jgi:hypothetical protein